MSKFTEAVRQGTDGLSFLSTGFCTGCPECRDSLGICCEDRAQAMMDKGEINDEGSFSWSACDCCGSSLGGDRHAAHGCLDDGTILHMEVCVDCLAYLANGDEPEER